MEKVLEKVSPAKAAAKMISLSKFVALQLAISIPVGISYYWLCAWTNAGSYTIGQAMFTIRWANMLRALALISPGAALGTGYGAAQWNVTAGRADLSFPIFITVLGFAIYAISQLIGRSTKKDLALVITYGALGGFFTSMKKVSWLAVTQIDVVRQFFTTRMMITIALYVAGYFIFVKGWEKIHASFTSK